MVFVHCRCTWQFTNEIWCHAASKSVCWRPDFTFSSLLVSKLITWDFKSRVLTLICTEVKSSEGLFGGLVMDRGVFYNHNNLYILHPWFDFHWRNLKVCWAVCWFAVLEVLSEDCEVGKSSKTSVGTDCLLPWLFWLLKSWSLLLDMVFVAAFNLNLHSVVTWR